MEELRSLLISYKKEDKIIQNVVIIISDTMTHKTKEIAKLLSTESQNNPELEDLIEIIKKRNKNYEEFAVEENVKRIKKTQLSEEIKEKREEDREEDREEEIKSEIQEDDGFNFFILSLFQPIQCKLCGLRYSQSEGEVLSLHLQDHQRRARSEEGKNVNCRKFFCRKTEWLINKLDLPQIIETKNKIKSNKPRNCKVCNMKIDLSWDDEDEQWILEDAIEINKNNFCHRRCVE